MARPISYWYNIIIAEKNTLSNLNDLQPNIDSNQQLLDDLTTPSRVEDWRLWVWCVAVCCYTLDSLLDLFKLELAILARNARIGQLNWYIDVCLNFYQDGYSLIWQNNEFQYTAIVPTARVVKIAAAEENGNQVLLKVAKYSGSNIVPLNTSELFRLDKFWNGTYPFFPGFKPAGITVSIISDVPDDLKLYLKVNYNPLVLTATGESIINPGVFPVEDVVNTYIKNLPFNAFLELCLLVDKIQLVSGVNSAYVLNAEARYGSNPFVAFLERYKAYAGHMAIFSGTPINTTITYVNGNI